MILILTHLIVFFHVQDKQNDAPPVPPPPQAYTPSQGENRNESELLAEWLRLTRERSEARSKEKTLVIRGQEIELEHRHARLQAQLSDIMSSAPDGRKSSEEVALEGRILREMLEIVERKNSLAAQLQAETQRWFYVPSGVVIALVFFLVHYLLVYFTLAWS
ncbi:unnamed protein product [Nesidiocoris tenuis]|uniref:BMERB domain-containing protein n=1 Tax=Nesidiocoris tenuis TaxID=355587 RepID=A0A6H5GS45_9HEMI|nr:unnamed protein product [Nesidiocoris tenuis]